MTPRTPPIPATQSPHRPALLVPVITHPDEIRAAQQALGFLGNRQANRRGVEEVRAWIRQVQAEESIEPGKVWSTYEFAEEARNSVRTGSGWLGWQVPLVAAYLEGLELEGSGGLDGRARSILWPRYMDAVVWVLRRG